MWRQLHSASLQPSEVSLSAVKKKVDLVQEIICFLSIAQHLRAENKEPW